MKAEHSFGSGYKTVKDYVHEHKLSARETFVPLTHAPGHAQVDFGVLAESSFAWTPSA